MAWRTNRRDHNGSATGRDRAQCSLRAGLEHRWRDCLFRNRLFPFFPVTSLACNAPDVCLRESRPISRPRWVIFYLGIEVDDALAIAEQVDV
jgi:hypothetical protein